MKRVIVVGSGFSGSVIARKIAEELDLKVIIVEKRPHIAGNMYDEYDDRGILIQKYGPHFINTDKYFIIEFLMKYSELFKHDTKLLSFIDGKYVQLPFNFKTLQQLIGDKKSEILLDKLRKTFYGRDRVPILELVQHEDKDISAYGNLLFEKAYRTYTSKQWGISPEKIDKCVLDRVPMAMNYDERYINKDFQYLPLNGFSKLFENMLNHPNIEIMLNDDANKHIGFDPSECKIYYDNEYIDLLVYTGAIDELFSLKYGSLPYRSLDIKYEYQQKDSILPAEIVSYPQADKYTRATEYKKITKNCKASDISLIATEYPLEYNPSADIGNIPYYPVLTEESIAIYKKYENDCKNYKNLVLCGRLAEFKYYNMDTCIEHALSKFEGIKKYLEEL